MDKKVTRKEFLLSGLSIIAVFAMSKMPSMITKKLTPPLSKQKDNAYGNHIYGGSKNA